MRQGGGRDAEVKTCKEKNFFTVVGGPWIHTPFFAKMVPRLAQRKANLGHPAILPPSRQGLIDDEFTEPQNLRAGAKGQAASYSELGNAVNHGPGE